MDPQEVTTHSESMNEEKEEINIAESLAEAAAGLANLNTPMELPIPKNQNYVMKLQLPTSFSYTTHPDPEEVLHTMLGAGSFTDQTHEQCAYILQRIDQVRTLERCNCLSGILSLFKIYKFYMNFIPDRELKMIRRTI